MNNDLVLADTPSSSIVKDLNFYICELFPKMMNKNRNMIRFQNKSKSKTRCVIKLELKLH